MKIIIKTLTMIVEVLLILICSSELYEFLYNPNEYHIGSEAMIENGGWAYRSNFTFIFFNSIMIAFSILLSILALKSKKINFQLLILFMAICQLGCWILL